jgi:hypothetical protein
MQKVLIATLMAVGLGLISMPVAQAAPAGGVAINSAAKAISPIVTVRRRRHHRCHWRHSHRSRRHRYCGWFW